MDKKISIIIPAYNAEKYLQSCLDSCLRQSYKNTEIIVINDGSTDQTEAVIKPYLKHIVYLKQENLGGSAARNKGLSLASGEYIYFLDADDILEKDSLKSMATLIEQQHSDICIGNYSIIDQTGNMIRTVQLFNQDKLYYKKELPNLFHVHPNPSSKLYLKSIIDKNSIVFDNLKISQDLNFYLKYLICCNTASTINTPIYKYRIVVGSISRTYSQKILDIIKSFNFIKAFCVKQGALSIYEQCIQNVKLLHLGIQLEKTCYIVNKSEREYVFNTLKQEYKATKPNKSCITYKSTRKSRLKANLIILAQRFYTSNLYHNLKIKGKI